MATPASVASQSQEVVQRIHRITRENRSLWYQLTVLQQPERARACGSGMKANSDRRPVDPPPVVELRIIEGPSVEEGKDITFDYNANFFLYASLEHARQVVHGRVQNSAATSPPILTGVPASGMAYLDRPTEAGYFIFPDLSVRHEGYFRLSLSLYELTKEEKDFDLEPAEFDIPPGVDWRMEIKTKPFNVFSAKKFPGLMESTSLSKTVADQGCRVRIRRDVRMRKRDNKGSGYDRREEEYARRRPVSPSGPPADDGSPHDQRMSLYGPSQRRQSMADGYSAAAAAAAAPQPPPPSSYDNAQPPPTRSSHLPYGEHAAAVSQYTTRQYGPPQSGPSIPVSLGAPYHTASQPPYGKNDASAQAFPYGVRGATQSLSSPSLSDKPDNYESRAPGAYVPPSPILYSAVGNQSRRDSLVPYTPTSMTAQQSPRSIRPQPPLHPGHPSHAAQVHAAQAAHPGMRIASLVSPLPPIEAQTEPLPVAPMLTTGAKRKHDFVFSQNTKPLHNGQRQLDPHYGHGYRGHTPEPDQGTYSRADGKIEYVTFNQYQV